MKGADPWPWMIRATYYPGGERFPVLVDPCVHVWASRYSWYLNRDGYVFRNRTIYRAYGRSRGHRVKTVRQYLHREIVGLRRRHRRVVHHDNGDPTDCRLQNLHVMTAARNARLALKVRGDRPLWAVEALRGGS